MLGDEMHDVVFVIMDENGRISGLISNMFLEVNQI